MSRVELDAIQTKLKAAILNHQMLVKKMKGDIQNPAFKSSLGDVQEEIKKLSEEQKKIVVKLRETLVKSSSLQAPPHAGSAIPVLSVGQTVTALGQPRLVSFSSQGGATILPVSMLAVPIAHVQRPALGMALNAGGQMCAQTNLSLHPADYVSAVAASAQIPAGLFNNGQAIPVNSSIALQNSIAINNITNAINVSNLNGGLSLHNFNGRMNLNSVNSSNIGNVIGSGIAAGPSVGNIVLASKNRSQITSSNGSNCSTNNNNNNNNQTIIITQQNTQATISTASMSSSNSNTKNGISTTSNTSPVDSIVSTSLSVTSNVGGSGPPLNEQPLVQPHLLQQQQQQILQMIQLQQPPQQRLASHFPIKVPQYTASPIRTIVSSTSVQYCNIAPAPMPFVPTCSVKPSVIPTPAVIDFNKSEAIKPLSEKDVAKPKEIKVKVDPPSEISSERKKSLHEKKKIEFMQALDLYTPEALKEMLNKRNERKRRTTANPQYSIGFESNRRHRNGSLWEEYAAKRAKVAKRLKNNEPPQDKASEQPQSGSNKTVDNHEDFCAACGKGGKLLMCETCRLVYHLDCLKPPLTEAPKYPWSCPKCLVSGKGYAQLNNEALTRVHSYIGKRASKEDERKKLQRKRNEINYEKSFLDNRSKKLEAEMKDQKGLKTKLEGKEKESKKQLQNLSELVRNVRQLNSISTSSSPVAHQLPSSTSISSPTVSVAISETAQVSPPSKISHELKASDNDDISNLQPAESEQCVTNKQNLNLVSNQLHEDESVAISHIAVTVNSDFQDNILETSIAPSLASVSCDVYKKETALRSETSLPLST